MNYVCFVDFCWPCQVAAAMVRHGYPLNAEAKRTGITRAVQWTSCMTCRGRFLCLQDYQPVKTPRLTLMQS